MRRARDGEAGMDARRSGRTAEAKAEQGMRMRRPIGGGSVPRARMIGLQISMAPLAG